MDSLDTIQGFDISFSDYSKRIINIKKAALRLLKNGGGGEI